MTFRSLVKLAAAAIAIMSGTAIAQTVSPVYFSFISTHQKTHTPHEFVFGVTNPAVIAKLREILQENYSGDELHIEGKIVTTRADYNEEWPFHFDPDTIQLFKNEIEHCDADPFEVEDNLALIGIEDPNDPRGGFLVNHVWCPYTSRVVREVKYTPEFGFGR